MSEEIFEIWFGGKVLRVEVIEDIDEYALDEMEERYGKYTDRAEPGAIRRRNASRNEYKYFVPVFTPDDVEDCRQWYRRNGFSRHDAWLRATEIPRQQFERAEAYNNQCWCFLTVSVTVSYNDIELGKDSTYGIESDSKNYLAEVKAELLESILHNVVRHKDDVTKEIRKALEKAETIGTVKTMLETPESLLMVTSESHYGHRRYSNKNTITCLTCGQRFRLLDSGRLHRSVYRDGKWHPDRTFIESKYDSRVLTGRL